MESYVPVILLMGMLGVTLALSKFTRFKFNIPAFLQGVRNEVRNRELEKVEMEAVIAKLTEDSPTPFPSAIQEKVREVEDKWSEVMALLEEAERSVQEASAEIGDIPDSHTKTEARKQMVISKEAEDLPRIEEGEDLEQRKARAASASAVSSPSTRTPSPKPKGHGFLSKVFFGMRRDRPKSQEEDKSPKVETGGPPLASSTPLPAIDADDVTDVPDSATPVRRSLHTELLLEHIPKG
ncbi:unnamed protein product [Darwinula stevensoni]|uniref:Uncharacterized protein n=1 Tax=Darwinula stevensoni TaxID=69355 RepID=A0A7R8WYZ9_9CRUS|nr:unnamed protein product [Darwinula stevensoni]CAG0879997.1 unnamed protein product [Darwinula stevensoni]